MKKKATAKKAPGERRAYKLVDMNFVEHCSRLQRFRKLNVSLYSLIRCLLGVSPSKS